LLSQDVEYNWWQRGRLLIVGWRWIIERFGWSGQTNFCRFVQHGVICLMWPAYFSQNVVPADPQSSVIVSLNIDDLHSTDENWIERENRTRSRWVVCCIQNYCYFCCFRNQL